MLRTLMKRVLLLPPFKHIGEQLCDLYRPQHRSAPALNIPRFDVSTEEQFYDLLYAKGLLDITGDFPRRDAEALERLVRDALKRRLVVVEVGSWKGLSTAVLARTVMRVSGSVFAVDHWQGSEGVPHHDCAKTTDIFFVFRRNLMALGLWPVVHPLVMNSRTASRLFVDGSVDMVFLDADHRYTAVKQDIRWWLPKLRGGGILCGHDCEGHYDSFSPAAQQHLRAHMDDDCIPNIQHPGVVTVLRDTYGASYSIKPYAAYPEHVRRQIERYIEEPWAPNGHPVCHPGTILALNEYFGTQYTLMRNSTIWYHVRQGTVAVQTDSEETPAGLRQRDEGDRLLA